MQSWTWTVCGAVALLLGGCSKQADQPAGSGPAAAPARQPEEQASSADEAEVPAGKEAGQAEAAAETAEAAARAARVMGTGADEAPACMKKLFVHIKEITRLTRENLDDCVKAAEVVRAYVDKHQEEMDALSRQAREAAEKMSDAEKIKYGMQVQALFASEMKEILQVQMQFAQKCSEQAKVIGGALSKLEMK